MQPTREATQAVERSEMLGAGLFTVKGTAACKARNSYTIPQDQCYAWR